MGGTSVVGHCLKGVPVRTRGGLVAWLVVLGVLGVVVALAILIYNGKGEFSVHRLGSLNFKDLKFSQTRPNLVWKVSLRMSSKVEVFQVVLECLYALRLEMRRSLSQPDPFRLDQHREVLGG